MMHRTTRIPFYLIFLLPTSFSLEAASVFRCEDNQGQVTFTLQGCSAGQTQEVRHVDNPPPGNGRPVAMAKSGKAASRTKANDDPASSVTVIAEQQDGCGNRVTGSQRRTAIIRKQVQAGMTREDVESALGKPDQESSRNGETLYAYKDERGSDRQIRFDQNGCVKSKK